MKDLNEFLNEGKKYKKGDIVRMKPEFSDSEDDGDFELIENPDGGRVKVRAVDSGLSIPPVEVVKLEWLEPKK